MRQQLSRLIMIAGMWSVACATAIEEGGYGSPLAEESGSSPGGSLNRSGSSSGGSGNPGSSGSVAMTMTGGKGGTSTGNAFGGSATSGGKAGSGSSGGAGGAAGTSTGGKGGMPGSGGQGTAGSGTAGSGGSGSAGAPASTVCDAVPDWTSKTYALGDSVASTCGGPFTGGCPAGQSHKFECSPQAGAVALAWCQQREPGKGNGWAEAWVDKGQCQ